MAQGGFSPAGGLYMALGFLSFGLCIAISVIVDVKFWQFYYYRGSSSWGWSYNSYSTCSLNNPDDSYNSCYYTWALCAVGFFLSIFLFFVSCCAARNGYAGRSPTAVVLASVAGFLWWLAGAIVNMIYLKDFNNDLGGLDANNDYRTSVWAMCWGQVALFLVLSGVAINDLMTYRRNPPPAYPTGAFVDGAYPQQPTVVYPAQYGPPPTQPYPPQAYPPQAYPPQAYPQQPIPQAYPPPTY